MEALDTKFHAGDEVTIVGNGKRKFTVDSIDRDYTSASGQEVYFVLNEEGGRSRSEVRHMTLVSLPRTVVSFDDVVMSPDMREQILEAVEQVNQHDLIFRTWGFAETIEKGRGVSMLFYGEPGTGKTLTAQAIADNLKRKLIVISTADIQSSAPGESERNIRKHFKEATGKDVIILFDECDSLIYRRSATGPILSAQINELLSQLERFEGLTIFTTNRLGVLDEAVNRRLALKLNFPMPSVEERVKIWKRMFPSKAPLAKGIKWTELGRAEITGGYIKNVVLRAARMAATEKVAKGESKQIAHRHLSKALEQELRSIFDFKEAQDTEKRRTMNMTDMMGNDESGQRVVSRATVGASNG